MGYEALEENTTGTPNTALGYRAMTANTTGGSNVAVGKGALDANTTGGSNVAVGVDALGACTTGGSNTCIGKSAGESITTGINNVALGINALATETTGGYSIAIGRNALNVQDGVNTNVAVGYNTGAAISSGGANTIIGYVAGDAITTGVENTIMGYNCATNATTAGNCTIIGENSCGNLGVGDFCTVIGADNNVDTSDSQSRLGLGYNLSLTTDNSVKIGSGGNFISNTFTSNATWAHSSDERLKENINDDSLGLSFINDLRPVTYTWKEQKDVPEEIRDTFEKDTENLQHGMLAQDVKSALDKAGVDTFAGWSEEKDGTQMISEDMFVFPLIKAVQELSMQVEELKAKLNKGE